MGNCISMSKNSRSDNIYIGFKINCWVLHTVCGLLKFNSFAFIGDVNKCKFSAWFCNFPEKFHFLIRTGRKKRNGKAGSVSGKEYWMKIIQNASFGNNIGIGVDFPLTKRVSSNTTF